MIREATPLFDLNDQLLGHSILAIVQDYEFNLDRLHTKHIYESLGLSSASRWVSSRSSARDKNQTIEWFEPAQYYTMEPVSCP